MNGKGNKDKNIYITFVGSRKAPDFVIKKYAQFAESYARQGCILRSGNAYGFDQVLKGVPESKREIYLPYDGFGPKISGANIYIPSQFSNYRQAVAIVRMLHPNKKLNDIHIKYLARDVYQILGKDLDTPCEKVYCWTEDGADRVSDITSTTGGTAMAIRVAEQYHIPVINLNKSTI